MSRHPRASLWRTLGTAFVVCLLLASHGAAAPNFAFTLFDRYLESLRQQASIPGLSATVVADGEVVWERGFGLQNIERGIAAAPDTPYPILDLTETLASTLAFECVERLELNLTDRVDGWSADAPADATVWDLLSHTDARGGFRYDPVRFAALTPVLDACGGRPFPRQLVRRILDPAAMFDTVPGQDLQDPSAPTRLLFEQGQLDRFAGVLGRVAVPYHADRNGRPVKTEFPVMSANAATGVISTVRDLARYDIALADDGLLVHDDSLEAAWSNTALSGGNESPMGLGWFVQRYNGERVVWHFGLARDAYSSLIVKVPRRHLTLILLANSDGLSAPFPLANGDVTASVFAQLFLRTFVP